MRVTTAKGLELTCSRTYLKLARLCSAGYSSMGKDCCKGYCAEVLEGYCLHGKYKLTTSGVEKLNMSITTTTVRDTYYKSHVIRWY